MSLRPSELRAGGVTSAQWSVLLARTVNVTHDSPLVQSWNHTDIVLHMPEGGGRDLDVLIHVSGQTSQAVDELAFTYDPPIVYGWRRAVDRSPEECLPR